MAKILTASDDVMYLNVTPHALELWRSKTLELFVLWEKGQTTYKLPIHSEEELTFAMGQEGKYICIEIGKLDVKPKKIDLDKVDAITHDGYLYVRFNDIL